MLEIQILANILSRLSDFTTFLTRDWKKPDLSVAFTRREKNGKIYTEVTIEARNNNR